MTGFRGTHIFKNIHGPENHKLRLEFNEDFVQRLVWEIETITPEVAKVISDWITDVIVDDAELVAKVLTE